MSIIYSPKCYRYNESFDWIYGIRLVAVITQGKQKLLIIDRFGIVIGSISCIHTAICTIDPEELLQQDQLEAEHLFKETLNIRSSEKLQEIHLSPSDKWFAFRSWVKGIAEAGIQAIHIQKEIEDFAHLITPISHQLIKAIIMVKPDFILEYTDEIIRECRFEGKLHNSSFFSNMNLIINNFTFTHRFYNKCIKCFKYLFNHDDLTAIDNETIFNHYTNVFKFDINQMGKYIVPIITDLYEWGYMLDTTKNILIKNLKKHVN